MRQQYHRQPEATSIGKMSIAHVDTWVNVPERPLAKVCYGSNGHPTAGRNYLLTLAYLLAGSLSLLPFDSSLVA